MNGYQCFFGNETVPTCPGYQKYVDPGISPELQAAAMQFGFSVVPSGIYMSDLAQLYSNDVSNLELFPGGLLQSLECPGPVFSSIILDEFTCIRNVDRFWFENS
ncbi:dual oxidase 1-like [Arapaima gigas]